MSVKVNIGCGRTPTEGWINMDNSPAIKLANSPIKYYIAKRLKMLSSSHIENIEWNKINSIKFAEATKKLPIDDNSVDCIYTSHMLEHLSQIGARKFLKEVLRILKIGGIIRISVPNLRLEVDEYILKEDADVFMRNIFVEAPPIDNLIDKIKILMYGYRHHQWMYDQKSLCKLLDASGFKDIEICNSGYSRIYDTKGLDLYERSDGSVIVEGVK